MELKSFSDLKSTDFYSRLPSNKQPQQAESILSTESKNQSDKELMFSGKDSTLEHLAATSSVPEVLFEDLSTQSTTTKSQTHQNGSCRVVGKQPLENLVYKPNPSLQR